MHSADADLAVLLCTHYFRHPTAREPKHSLMKEYSSNHFFGEHAGCEWRRLPSCQNIMAVDLRCQIQHLQCLVPKARTLVYLDPPVDRCGLERGAPSYVLRVRGCKQMHIACISQSLRASSRVKTTEQGHIHPHMRKLDHPDYREWQNPYEPLRTTASVSTSFCQFMFQLILHYLSDMREIDLIEA